MLASAERRPVVAAGVEPVGVAAAVAVSIGVGTGVAWGVDV
ncbi:hypothetical protein [Microbacterium testaceum]|nr:hypothetical protein [Microbacterium testaceum]